MSPTDPLSAALCPLMTPRLIDDYNALASVLRTLNERVPRLREAITRHVGHLGAIRDRMTREKFQVGLLGATQATKSTTFNNALGVMNDLARRPSHEGNGSSTTSVITRLRAGDADGIVLNFATAERYAVKRAALCRTVGIDPAVPDAEILNVRLPEVEKKIARGELRANVEDPRYLRKVLKAHQLHGDRLGAPATAGEYDKRNKYLTHDTASDEGTPWLLLDDALVSFRTDAIHGDLELIDLPGLGAHATVDTLISRERLELLDAALVFVLITKRDDEVAENIFNGLRVNFAGDFRDRVWLVLTKCDGLGRSFLLGKDDNPENGFDGVAKLAARHRLPMSQVLMISNRVSELRRRDPDGRVSRDALLDKLDFHDPEPLPGLDRNPALVPVFEELARNGGLDKLRDMLKGELVEAVRKRAHDWVASKLRDVRDAVAKEVEFAARRSGEDLLPQINQCAVRVDDRLVAMKERTTFFDAPAAKLRESLTDNFSLRFAAGRHNDSLGLPHLKARYPGDSRSLDIALQLHMEALIPNLYEQVGEAFAGLPDVPVRGESGVRKAWTALGSDPSAVGAVFGSKLYPTFDDPDMLDVPDEAAESFDGGTYRRLWTEKIAVHAQQAVHVLRWRIVGELLGVAEELRKLTVVDPAEAVGPAKVDYPKMLETLRTLCPST